MLDITRDGEGPPIVGFPIWGWKLNSMTRVGIGHCCLSTYSSSCCRTLCFFEKTPVTFSVLKVLGGAFSSAS